MKLLGSPHARGGLALSTRRVLKNTVSQALSFGAAMAMGGVAAVLVARALGPDGLGVFMPAWQLAVSLSIVALLGIDQWTIRELARGNTTRQLESTLALSCVLGLLFGSGAAFLPSLVGVDEELARAFVVAGAYVAVSAPALVLRFSFHARERMEVETLTVLVEAVVALVAVPLALALGASAAWAIVGLGAGRVANLLLAVGCSRRLWGRLGPRPEIRRWGTILRASIPLGVSFSFTTMVLRFDVVLVGILLSTRDAGVYSAAAVVTFAIPMIVTSLNRSLYPVLSRAHHLDHPELRTVFARTWRFLFVTGLAMAAGLAVLARPAVELVFGADFAPSADVLAALAWLLPIRLLNNLCATTLNATTWKPRQAVVFAGVIASNLVANVVLIPILGYWGAVYAAAGTETLLLALLVAMIRRVRPPVVRPLVEGVGIAALTATVAFWTPGHVLLRTATGSVVFGLLILAVHRADTRDSEPRPLNRS